MKRKKKFKKRSKSYWKNNIEKQKEAIFKDLPSCCKKCTNDTKTKTQFFYARGIVSWYCGDCEGECKLPEKEAKLREMLPDDDDL